MAHPPSAASWCPRTRTAKWVRAHRADARRCCADGPTTLLRLIARPMGQGWLRRRGLSLWLEVHHSRVRLLCRGVKFVHTGKLNALAENCRT